MHRIRIIAVAAVLLAAGAALAQSPAGATIPELYRRSYAAEAQGELAPALQAMEEMGARGAADYVFQLRRAWLLYRLGRNAESLVGYQKAIALEPKALEPRLGAMLPAMAMRRWADTEKLCAEVLAVAPGDFLALSRMAYASYQLGRWEKAAGWYRRTLALHPANVEMQAGLAWSLLKQGKSAEARAEFERILAVAPDHASAREGFGLLR